MYIREMSNVHVSRKVRLFIPSVGMNLSLDSGDMGFRRHSGIWNTYLQVIPIKITSRAQFQDTFKTRSREVELSRYIPTSV